MTRPVSDPSCLALAPSNLSDSACSQTNGTSLPSGHEPLPGRSCCSGNPSPPGKDIRPGKNDSCGDPAGPGNAGPPSGRLPAWLRRPLPSARSYFATESLLDDLHLATVCQGAKCPNIHECFSCGTATFLVLGRVCTRNCAFCNIAPGKTEAPDPDEPGRVAQAALRLGLKHTVVTSVTRDDLADGGAGHFAAVIKALRQALPQSTIEVLIPDFKGSRAALGRVMQAAPDVINHNVETHPALYAHIRPQADYAQSLELLRRVKAAGLPAKSGFMVGLGETDGQVRELLRDLRDAGCSMVTVGQYMRPSKAHPAVARYVHPDMFAAYAEWGRELGIKHVFAAPLVRSSYQAAGSLEALRAARG